MDTKTTPRQRDIDGRLRRETGNGLADWLVEQRQADASYRAMSLALHGLTGDSVSDETLRTWCRQFGAEPNGNGKDAA